MRTSMLRSSQPPGVLVQASPTDSFGSAPGGLTSAPYRVAVPWVRPHLRPIS